jgi:ABC-type transporter Mla subunit MlaD
MTALRDRLPTRHRPPRRRGRPAGKQRGRAFTLSVGFAAIVIAVFMFYIGYEAPQSVPLRSYYNLHAVFANADNLEDHYEVRIGGVRAGQVLNPRVVNHHAEVDLQLSSQFKPLLSDSRILIRLRSAVGVRYVDIVPGTQGTRLPEGATIPISNTSAPVDLDQVLRTFDPQTRLATSRFLSELGAGVNGQGQNINDMLGRIPGFLANVGSVSAAINARPSAMQNFISASQGAAAAVDPVSQDLANGFRPEMQALEPFVQQASAVQSTLDQAPSTLSTLQSDLPAVTQLVAQVNGLAQAAIPTLSNAPGALDATTSLLNHAQPGLRGLGGTLQLAHNAVPPTLSFLTAVDPALPDINRAMNNGRPIVQQVAPRACGLSDAFTGWSQMMKWGTAVDNFIRFSVTPASTILTGQNTVTNPSTPYPTPCVGQVGTRGGAGQTPEQQLASP